MKLVKIVKYNKYGKELPLTSRHCLNCNNDQKICPCSVYSGNPVLPNLFNKSFPVKEIKNNYHGRHEEIYEANLR